MTIQFTQAFLGQSVGDVIDQPQTIAMALIHLKVAEEIEPKPVQETATIKRPRRTAITK
jgi:hypothetical protein